jgi:hypothetical protein
VFATSYNLKTNDDAMSLWSYEQVLAEHDLDGDGSTRLTEAKANTSVLSRPDADGEGDHPLLMFQRFSTSTRTAASPRRSTRSCARGSTRGST